MPSLAGSSNRASAILWTIAVNSATAVGLAAIIVLGLYDGRSARAASSAVMVGAGDIASCSSDGDEATAKLLDTIHGTVFTLGDNAYDSGTSAEFANCYDPTWGRHKDRTRPAPGNHDYFTKGASGYYGYFGAKAGDPARGYYSYNRAEWHIVVLNSNCSKAGGCGKSSAQLKWLKSDLRVNKERACTLAYWHHPRFSSGSEHGSDPRTRSFWRVLYKRHADVIVNGHDHDYERFALQAPDGTRDLRHGIREFVVGTGGKELRPFGSVKPNSQVRSSETHGVLKLTLNPTGYRWKFVPVAGETFTDSGSTRCH
jgi:acid phosphatase type 7